MGLQQNPLVVQRLPQDSAQSTASSSAATRNACPLLTMAEKSESWQALTKRLKQLEAQQSYSDFT